MAITAVNYLNPIKVTGTCSSAEKVTDKAAYIKFIQWYKPTTAAHLLSVVDKDGQQIVKGYCENANETQWLPIFTRFDSIYIDDMDSGEVYIYIS